MQDAKKSPKIRHLGPIAQPCRTISSQLRHVSTIGKKLVKQQCLPHMFSQYELRPTSGWDLLTSLRHPRKFQRVSHLGSVTARHYSSGRQPNFAALNRGRHLYLAGRPSRWALAHTSSSFSIHHLTPDRRGHQTVSTLALWHYYQSLCIPSNTVNVWHPLPVPHTK